MLLLRLPRPEVGGGLGDRDGCRDEFGVETRDRADVDVGVSDLRFESSTYLGFWIDLRLDETVCCSSEARARAVFDLWRLPDIFFFQSYAKQSLASHQKSDVTWRNDFQPPVFSGLSDPHRRLVSLRLGQDRKKESENEKCLKSSNQVEADDRDSNAFRPPLGH